MLTGLRDDTRISSAPVLMSLGYAVTINPDDPGKFGYEDSTVDYFSSLISFLQRRIGKSRFFSL